MAILLLQPLVFLLQPPKAVPVVPPAPASRGQLCYRLLLPPVARLRVVPFLGLVVVHRRGALGAAWSMWSTTDFHRKSTIRGEANSWVHAAARKCLLITRKIIIPPPDRRDPPYGPPYFTKKMFPPMSDQTHQKCLLIMHKKIILPC